MWRIVILVPVLLVAGVFARADVNTSATASAALVQIQDCLDLKLDQQASMPAITDHRGQGANGLSLRGLASTLGIGLLTIICFVPAALLAEMLTRRDGQDTRKSHRAI